jgi:uncharacterized membrane protein YqiK
MLPQAALLLLLLVVVVVVVVVGLGVVFLGRALGQQHQPGFWTHSC